MKSLKILAAASLAACLVAGCSSAPVNDEFRLPVQDAMGGAPNNPQHHQMQPRDVIDAMFKFDTLSNTIYKLAAHDKIRIRFLSAPEYDDNYQIRPDGYISMPFVGDVKVAGMTVDGLRKHLESLYEPVLKKPEFHVNVLEYQVHLKELQTSLFHPNLGNSRLLTVRDDNVVSFPLIGEIAVNGKTLQDVREAANQKYAAIDPGLQIDLMLQSSEANRIFVLGEVQNPGAFPINGPVSLMQAVALSGGANVKAELGSVVAMHREGNEVVAKVFDLKNALRGKDSAFTAQVGNNDVIYVPATRLGKSADVMRQLSEALMFRGVGYTFTYRTDDKGEE
ncbi:Predicted polysaccharide export protein [gamma proteobacterium HdN1]|nr:Predicted polysaccharide export protein [gamma proteobacterium HdN1]